MAKGQTLYDWCMKNGEWGKQLLYEFGDGNNCQQFINEYGFKVHPSDFTRASHIKIKWTCHNNHEWLAPIGNRTQIKTQCPYCCVRKGTSETNLYDWCKNHQDKGEQLLREWTGQSIYNNHYNMKELSYGSKKKMLWKCSAGHTWYQTVYARTQNQTFCKKCKNIANSVLIWCQSNGDYGKQLINEWTGICDDGNHYEINEVAKASKYSMLWKCSKGHEWYASINSRTNNNTNCPICANDIRKEKAMKRAVVYGENDLYTWCIENDNFGKKIMDEWTGICIDESHYNMTNLSYASQKKMLWRCSKGHEWYSTIVHRTVVKTSCPYCCTKSTSYPEQFLYRALKQIYPQTISRGKFQGIEYDITIPEERTCIEYSGANWHSNKIERDQMKADICYQYNMRFIQIYANKDDIKSDNYGNDLIIYSVSSNKDIHNTQLEQILNHILKSFNRDISEIDIEKAQTEAFNFMHDIDNDEDNE